MRTRAAPSLRRGAAACGLLMALALAGCAGESSIPFLEPKVPDVPKVEAGNFPNFSVPPTPRPPAMTPDQLAKVQAELENAANDAQRRLQQADADAQKDQP
ncbi:hypothetical protein [Roseixanthobacter glucoisosaccharinicivorans]|uniref:hypothetical protein n=1 Tax=Roseixanthobacter glucoisosaccharinicivorans TaxID=3119923 RepID=UPI00372A2D0A